MDATLSRLLLTVLVAAVWLVNWPARGSEQHEHQLGSTAGSYPVANPHDPWLPDFCGTEGRSTPPVETRVDGTWDAPATWDGGRVPGANAVVLIRHAVVLEGAAEAGTACVAGGGSLRFAPAAATALRLTTLQIHDGGALLIGTAAEPVTGAAELVFKDRPLDLRSDPGQYGHGLLVQGDISIQGRPVGRSFLRLAREPRAGDRELELAEAAGSSWRVGDRLFLPDTRQQTAEPRLDYLSQGEEATIARVDGRRIILVAALAHDHRGARDRTGRLEFLPHAVHLSRNVVVRSENPSGVRAHVLLSGRAVRIAAADFQGLGRTTVEPLDDTVFDAQGRASHVGSNPRGRYALHLHHVARGCPSTGAPAFELIDNVVEGASRWGVVLHDAHRGRIEGNVVYGFQGAGFVTEDGSESHNRFMRNFAIGARAGERVAADVVVGAPGKWNFTNGPPAAGGVRMASHLRLAQGPFDRFDFGFEHSGFWLRLPHNRFEGNVVADVGFAAYNFNGYFLKLGVDLPPPCDGRAAVDGQGPVPLLGFADNEAYASAIGLWATRPTGNGDTVRVTPEHDVPSMFQRSRFWHLSHLGVVAWHATHLSFDGLTLLGDPLVAGRNRGEPARGIELAAQRGYETGEVNIRDARIHGYNVGISLPYHPEDGDPLQPDLTLVEGGDLANHVNVVEHPSTLDRGEKLTVIRGVAFHRVSLPTSRGLPATPADVWMHFDRGLLAHAYRAIRAPSRTFLLDHAGDPAADYELFFAEQQPEFQIPALACRLPLRDRAWQLVHRAEEASPLVRRQVFRLRRLLKYGVFASAGLDVGRSSRPWAGEVANRACMAREGTALAGHLAPCADTACANASRLPAILGYAFPAGDTRLVDQALALRERIGAAAVAVAREEGSDGAK